MAIVANNDLTKGLRGRVGKWLVFRTVRGKTIASHAPRKPDPRKQSAAQRLTRSTFREASAWAVCVLLDPVKKQYYADLAKVEALPNAYTAAVREYMQRVTAKTTENQLEYSVSTKKEANDKEQCGSTSSSPPRHIPSERGIQNVERHRSRLSTGICCSQHRTTIKSIYVWPEIDKLQRLLQLPSKQKSPAAIKPGHFKTNRTPQSIRNNLSPIPQIRKYVESILIRTITLTCVASNSLIINSAGIAWSG